MMMTMLLLMWIWHYFFIDSAHNVVDFVVDYVVDIIVENGINRTEKAEEEVAELVKKSQQLEVDLDKTTEQLLTTTQQLEEKEKALLGAELEVNALNRWVNLSIYLFI